MNQQTEAKTVVIAAARLPYHPALEERFGVGPAEWRALCDAIFPLAKDAESIILALSYCRARKLDPFKRVVHIVPMWHATLGRMVETVWPGIGELRTTAFRTGQYAGRDEAKFGPTIVATIGTSEMTFPEWCQVTAHRILHGQKFPFPGPRVYWKECYATTKKEDETPNSMWRKRPFGQLDKCAEAAALRAAFPEEIGNDYTSDEMAGRTLGFEPDRIKITPHRTLDEKLDVIAASAHDPVTGEIIDETAAADEEAASQLAAKIAEQTDGIVSIGGNWIDQPTQTLIDAGRAAATGGKAKYKKWENNLSAQDFDRIGPHLDALRIAAGASDARDV